MSTTNKSISLDEEGSEILKSMLKDNYEFNFSEWVNSKLKETQNTKKNFESIEAVEKDIETRKNSIKKLNSEIQIEFNLIDQLLIKKSEIETKRELYEDEQKKAQQKAVERADYKKKMVNDFFKADMKRDMSEDEYKEYLAQLDGGLIINIYDYIEKAKAKEKLATEIKQTQEVIQ